MTGLMGKVKGFFSDPLDDMDGELVDEYENSNSGYRSEYAEHRSEGDWRPSASRRNRPSTPPAPTGSNNVVSMPGMSQQTGEVVVMEPRSFDEMPAVIRNLRDRKSVVMNLTLMDPAEAQRSVDFVAGGTYAIDGHQERIGENIFLFTPNCVSVSVPGPGQTAAPATPVTPSRPVASPTPLWNNSHSPYSEPLPAVGGLR